MPAAASPGSLRARTGAPAGTSRRNRDIGYNAPRRAQGCGDQGSYARIMSFEIFSRLKSAAAALPGALDRAWHDDGLLSAAPPGADTEMGRLLWSIPRPLIHPGARLIVIFSQKSACTSTVIWYLHQLGHAKAARDFHHWPHNYLYRILHYSQLYRDAYALDLSKFTVVRIVRDPFERAVSSFRHALRHGYSDADIAKRLGYRDIAGKGLSFSTFLDFLEQVDLTTCDRHFCLQRHPIEDKLPVHHLINVTTQDLFTRLNEVEAAVGLPLSNMAADPWIKQLRGHHRPKKEVAGAEDLYTRLFTRQQAGRGPWPRHEALLPPQARERIARLYATDIKSYL